MKQFISITAIFLMMVLCASALEPKSIKKHGLINDNANMLSEQMRTKLEYFSQSVVANSGVALVFLSVKSLDDNDIDDFANRLYQEWGIGQKGEDAGVLVFIAKSERKIRIETGYGVEGYITDLKSSKIRREATENYLSKNMVDDGIASIFISLGKLIAQEKNISFNDLSRGAASVSKRQGRDVSRRAASPLSIVIFFIAVIFLLGTRSGRAMLPWILLFMMSGSRSGGYGGGSFGGGFGGGSFGGGMSGGGGSSGSF